MSEQEIKQFEAIISLYAKVNQYRNEFYIARFADMGYVSIQYIDTFGHIEQAQLYRTPKELFEFLEKHWEMDMLYDYMDEHNIKDTETFLENVPKELKQEVAQLHENLCKRAKEILTTK